MIEPVEEILKQRFGDCVYTDDPQVTLELAVAELLKKHCLTVTTAESCTGGLLAGRLINAPGISGQFREGYITYSNEAKEGSFWVFPIKHWKPMGRSVPRRLLRWQKAGPGLPEPMSALQ